MTKHELAAAKWREMRDDLTDRGVYNDSALEADRELNDQVQIARIEEALTTRVDVEEDNEDRLCLVDNALLKFNKPVGGLITVDSSAFSKYDGHVVVRVEQEMVIRFLNGQVFITLRQG